MCSLESAVSVCVCVCGRQRCSTAVCLTRVGCHFAMRPPHAGKQELNQLDTKIKNMTYINKKQAKKNPEDEMLCHCGLEKEGAEWEGLKPAQR